MEIKLQRFFCVIPDTTHDDCFYLLNGLDLFSNVSILIGLDLFSNVSGSKML